MKSDIDLQNITKFQKKVYKQLLLVPKGKVTTYKLLAESINCNCPQAVGQALKNNPFAPEIPCHRVIKSDFSIGGFVGSEKNEDLNKKMALLYEEGVVFKGRVLADKNCIFTF